MADVVEASEFDRIAQRHCRRWADKSIAITRAVLVDQRRPYKVAEEFGITQGHVQVLLSRFRRYMQRDALQKVPAEEFMRQVVPPLERAALLRSDVKRLVQHGYTDGQIADFLRANDVELPAADLHNFLEDLRR